MQTVLIFDDDADILELCSIILRDKGFVTVSESTSKQVIERTIAVKPDVILMDNRIPGIGGIQAIQLLKDNKQTAHIPVILFSANTNIEEIAVMAKADHFLKKPFDIATLSGTVDKAVQNSSVRS